MHWKTWDQWQRVKRGMLTSPTMHPPTVHTIQFYSQYSMIGFKAQLLLQWGCYAGVTCHGYKRVIHWVDGYQRGSDMCHTLTVAGITVVVFQRWVAMELDGNHSIKVFNDVNLHSAIKYGTHVSQCGTTPNGYAKIFMETLNILRTVPVKTHTM